VTAVLSRDSWGIRPIPASCAGTRRSSLALADDKNLASWFLGRLDDEVSSLGVVADRAAFSADLLGGPLAVETAAPPAAATSTARAPRPGGPVLGPDEIARNVFVVHGRDEQARDALFGFLRALGLQPLGWETLVSATGNTSPYLRDVIIQGIAMAQAAVVLMTPDDQGGPTDAIAQRPRSRQNVVFELGFFIGKLGPAKVAALLKGDVEKPSDFDGIAYIPFDSGGGWKQALARELHHAKVPFDPAKAFSA